jgi:hypothetical protein
MRTAKSLIGTVVLGAAALLLLPAAQAQDAPGSTKGGLHQPGPCPPHPSARGYANVAYDWTSGRAYLFGGADQLSWYYDLFDVWSYDSFTGRWKQLFADTDGSFFDAFQADAVALDPESQKVVVYATFVGASFTDVATWIYDLHTNTFTDVTSGTEPPLRWLYRMTFDPRSHRAILFGGFDGVTSTDLADTWAFDFRTNTWSNLHPRTSPPARGGHDLVYHPLAGRIILYGGGSLASSVDYTDTWAYDSLANTWTERHPHMYPTPGRGYARLAYDLSSNQILTFGGVLSGENWPHELTTDESWAYSYDRDTWKRLQPYVSPGPRAWQSMVGTWTGPVIFGGGPDRSAYTDETWVFESRRAQWSEIDLGPRGCPAF